MKLYKGNANLTAFQVTQAVSAIEFRIKKTTPAATVGEFLSGDTIKLTYSSAGQQSCICPTLPFDVLFHYSSMWNGFTQAITDATGKIIEVRGCVEIGYGGSVPLSTDKHLLIETNITGLAATDSLEVYAIAEPIGISPMTGQPVPVALTNYDYINLRSGQQTNTDVSSATALIFTPLAKDVTFTDNRGSAYVQSMAGLIVLARKLNECALCFGKFVADKSSIVGKTVATSAFNATGIQSGGERFVGISVVNYASMQVSCTEDDGFVRVTPKQIV